jgi:urea transporter
VTTLATRLDLPARFEAASRWVVLLLRVYAGCVFSTSPFTGILVFAATALTPLSCLLGWVAVASALGAAHWLGLLADEEVPTIYTYNALFIGLIAAHTFGNPAVALAFALLGAAASALLTSAIRSFTSHFGLPSLTLPFVIVYLCALSCGQALGVAWAAPPPLSATAFPWLPWYLRMFFDGLGAVICDPRTEVGMLMFLALLLSRWHAALLAALGFYLAVFSSWQLQRFGPELVLPAALNAVFTALGLGMGWYAPSWRSYLAAAVGAVLCVLITKSLSDPLGRMQLAPLSLPFNLSIYVVLLIAQRRREGPRMVAVPAARDRQANPDGPHPDRRLLGG